MKKLYFKMTNCTIEGWLIVRTWQATFSQKWDELLSAFCNNVTSHIRNKFTQFLWDGATVVKSQYCSYRFDNNLRFFSKTLTSVYSKLSFVAYHVLTTSPSIIVTTSYKNCLLKCHSSYNNNWPNFWIVSLCTS